MSGVESSSGYFSIQTGSPHHLAAHVDMLALDMDGTLLDHEQVLPPATITILQQLADCGKIVILASGRPRLALEPYYDMIGTSRAFIASNGGVIYIADRGQVRCLMLKPQTVADVLECVQQRPVAVFCETPAGIYAQSPPELRRKDLVLKGVDYHWCTDLRTILPMDIIKITMLGAVQTIARLMPCLQLLDRQASLVRTYPELAEISARGADKGSALTWLCEQMDILPGRVLAIGDGHNDLPLFRAAGYAAAVRNAHPDIQRVAHYVIPSNRDQGVVQFLQAFFL